VIQIPNLNITCNTPECGSGLHAFNNPEHTYQKRTKFRKHFDPGVCQACGVNLVDWSRLHARNLKDMPHTFSTLKLEYIRWEFWSRDFNEKSLNNARERGMDGLAADAHDTITKVIGPVAVSGWARRQVPTKPDKMKSVIEYAQHSVAACCRDCVEKWHGIPNEKPLSTDGIEYLSQLVIEYLEQRLPRDVLQPSLRSR